MKRFLSDLGYFLTVPPWTKDKEKIRRLAACPRPDAHLLRTNAEREALL